MLKVYSFCGNFGLVKIGQLIGVAAYLCIKGTNRFPKFWNLVWKLRPHFIVLIKLQFLRPAFCTLLPPFLWISRLRGSNLLVLPVEPSEKSVEIMRKFSEQYARKSGTYFCVDKGVTSVVIKVNSLFEHHIMDSCILGCGHLSLFHKPKVGYLAKNTVFSLLYESRGAFGTF